jgi:hypothetical protein
MKGEEGCLCSVRVLHTVLERGVKHMRGSDAIVMGRLLSVIACWI